MTDFEKTVRTELMGTGKTLSDFASDCGVSRNTLYKALHKPTERNTQRYKAILDSYKK